MGLRWTEVGVSMDLRWTEVKGHRVYLSKKTSDPHDDVLENVVALIEKYAQLCSLADIPPITLEGRRWGDSWGEIVAIERVRGNSGPSKEEERWTGYYTCLVLELPDESNPEPWYFHRTDLGGVIAHEITHLRWPKEQHGPPFFAKVRALLRGAQFPSSGKPWRKETQRIVREEREAVVKLIKDKVGLD